MTEFTNGLIAGVLAGGGLGCIAGFTVAALCAAAARADEQAEIDAAEFEDHELQRWQYGQPAVVEPGDEFKRPSDRNWTRCLATGAPPVAGWSYRRPVQQPQKPQ